MIIDRETKSNTSILKVRKISPESPVSPESQKSWSNSGEISGDIVSTGDIIPPEPMEDIRAQITSDIDVSGGPEVPEVLLQPPDESENPTQFEKLEVPESELERLKHYDNNSDAEVLKSLTESKPNPRPNEAR